MGESGGNGVRGIWSVPGSPPSAQDAAALLGMVEAVNHENKSSAVTLPAERHLDSVLFMVCSVDDDKDRLEYGSAQQVSDVLLIVVGEDESEGAGDGDGDGDHLQAALAGDARPGL